MIEEFIGIANDLQLKAIQFLDNDLESSLMISLTISTEDYAVRPQTITIKWDIQTITLPALTLIITAMLELCYHTKIETENAELLGHWIWEVRQLLEELYTIKVEIEQEEGNHAV
ncbi:hypothetical protein [Lactococcus allomyrinae]|uniref:Uncharacterized protein n=1 Tax=Lactococcus allomyrinae TaxID=2419773 RepID=A0A387BMS5_9LACT|nr:hypothetical protein [Lactococcus allomyrinae]AYF99830.1 hypothetical protein D7I46_01260 [Lactococcus allomyrinae]